MTKKKINIVLLLLVVGVWGSILYNVVGQYFLKNEIQPFNSAITLDTKIKLITKDTFEMALLNRDPFLSIDSKIQKSLIPISNFKKNVSNVNKSSKTVSFPSVYYFGYITTESNQSTVLLKIDNRKVKLSLNQEHEGVRLQKIYRDSIIILFNKESKVILKQK